MGAATACSSATTSRPERGRDMGVCGMSRRRSEVMISVATNRERSTASGSTSCRDSVRYLSPRCALLPPPAGEGWGGGRSCTSLRTCPHPCPSTASRGCRLGTVIASRTRVNPSSASRRADAGAAWSRQCRMQLRLPRRRCYSHGRTGTPSLSLRRMARIAIIALMLLAAAPARAEPAQPEAPPPASRAAGAISAAVGRRSTAAVRRAGGADAAAPPAAHASAVGCGSRATPCA